MSEYLYGDCECTGGGTCHCAHAPGPAAFVVERDGKTMKVCTRCDFASDVNKELLWKESDNVEVLSDYDALGLFCIVGMMAKAAEAKESSDGPA